MPKNPYKISKIPLDSLVHESESWITRIFRKQPSNFQLFKAIERNQINQGIRKNSNSILKESLKKL